MLVSTIRRRKLTQGQPPAVMVLPIQRVRSTTTAEPRAEEGGAEFQLSAALAPPAPVDPHEIARRVYDLMRQELALERERRGWRRG